MQLLQREGVEPIEARNKRFDPNWHEAVATVGHNGSDAPEDTVIEVVESGYRLGERMLRPAKVIVAV
jgi:molecular chaperone GrpE